ncbi:MAG: SMP-30/gluconolactonase/LRE family protein [Bacteroidetes bacterium]|nr:SMP-30/gluconolactonase/LRE family protein [Bacteroidota bacterium]
MVIRIVVLLILAWTHIAFCQSPIPSGAKLERIANGFKFVEGPVWKDGTGLLFSDIHPGIIYQWSALDSQVTIYLKPSDSSNGLTFDLQGNLILTQMRLRRIARQESNGAITPLAATYNGKRFNSPNDIVVTSKGSIYFTDPDFNTPAGEPKELSFKGVFRLSPSGTLQVMDSTFDKPNGICFSPDEKRLYVNESPQYKIYVWDVDHDSTISNKRLFYTIPMSGYADGMKVDPAGNVYCTGPSGVWIVSPAGTYLDKITTPETPTNCAWGDEDRKTLYITAGTGVYRIRLAPVTDAGERGVVFPHEYELCANYPNPFNPTTTLRYGLSERSRVRLTVYNTLGQEISQISDGIEDAGCYERVFDAGTLASGFYPYCFEAVSVVDPSRRFADVKVMLLLH